MDGEIKKDNTGDSSIYELVIVKQVAPRTLKPLEDLDPIAYYEESFERVRYNSYLIQFFDEPIKFWIYYKIDPILAIKDFVMRKLQ